MIVNKDVLPSLVFCMFKSRYSRLLLAELQPCQARCSVLFHPAELNLLSHFELAL